MKCVFYTAIVAAIVFGAATAFLVARNWSPKIYQPVLSIMFGGVVAAFITMTALLKPGKISDRFPVSILLDRKTNLPEKIFDSPWSVQARASSKANFEELEDGSLQSRTIVLATHEEKVRFYSELIQYLIVNEFDTILRGDFSISSATDGIARVEVAEKFRPEKFSKIPGAEIVGAMSTNRFLYKAEKPIWAQDSRWLPVPEDTTFSIPTKDTVIFESKGYFTIQIRIAPVGSANGAPPHLAKINQNADVETIGFIVTLDADFDRFSAESAYSAESKKWAEFLFSKIKRLMADPE
jgi:hypothetical protein